MCIPTLEPFIHRQQTNSLAGYLRSFPERLVYSFLTFLILSCIHHLLKMCPNRHAPSRCRHSWVRGFASPRSWSERIVNCLMSGLGTKGSSRTAAQAQPCASPLLLLFLLLHHYQPLPGRTVGVCWDREHNAGQTQSAGCVCWSSRPPVSGSHWPLTCTHAHW